MSTPTPVEDDAMLKLFNYYCTILNSEQVILKKWTKSRFLCKLQKSSTNVSDKNNVTAVVIILAVGDRIC